MGRYSPLKQAAEIAVENPSPAMNELNGPRWRQLVGLSKRGYHGWARSSISLPEAQSTILTGKGFC